MWFARFCRRLAGSVRGARILVHLADHFHLPALDAGLLQILHRRLRLSITIQNSDDYVLHELRLLECALLSNYISGAFKLPASRLRVVAAFCAGTARATTEVNSDRRKPCPRRRAASGEIPGSSILSPSPPQHTAAIPISQSPNQRASLLVMQRHHRIDSHRTPRRDVTAQRRHGYENQRRGHVSDRI